MTAIAEALIVGNDVEISWVSTGPVSPARIAGTVIAVNPEVVHISASGSHPKIVNVSRITEAVVRRTSAEAVRRRQRAIDELQRAVDALRTMGASASVAAEHIRAAVAALPGLVTEDE